MPTIYLTLGQQNPAATTPTTLYTVPAATSCIISTITVCNQAATAASYRIAIRKAGAVLSAIQYIAYDSTILANDTVALTLGITLAATDVVTVYASTATLSFNAFGTQIS